MKRALMYASVASMIQQFNMDNIRLLIEAGYQVDVACNMEEGSTISAERIASLKQELRDMGCGVFHIPVPRKISALKEILHSVKMTKQLIEENKYALIHCHSPIGGVISRIANRISSLYRKNTMIYTAHGFHFFKGGPKSGWLIFYPIEKFLSRWTNVLITINSEDFELAQAKMRSPRIFYVPGVGIDASAFRSAACSRPEKRESLGVPQEAFLLASVGELNENKNHQIVLRAMAQAKHQNVHYAVAGLGPMHDDLLQLSSDLGLKDRVHLLGYRTDVAEIYKAADVCVFPSIREGLGLAALEGMAAGLPLIAADNRGTRSYTVHEENGILCSHGDAAAFAAAIDRLADDPALCAEMGKKNLEISAKFDKSAVSPLMMQIYNA